MAGDTQSVLPETRKRLRHLVWLFFLPVLALAGIGVYYLTAERRLALTQAEADARSYLGSVAGNSSLYDQLHPKYYFYAGELYSTP